MELRFAQADIEMISDNGSHYIEGYGAIWGSTYYVPQDNIHERMISTAFHNSLARRKEIESRYNHSDDHILGTTSTNTLQVWADDKGLRYRVAYNPNDPDHQKVKAKLETGIIKGSSIAFIPKKVEFRSENNKTTAVITDAELYEVGPVNAPCNTATVASFRSQGTVPTMQELYKQWQATQEKIDYANTLHK